MALRPAFLLIPVLGAMAAAWILSSGPARADDLPRCRAESRAVTATAARAAPGRRTQLEGLNLAAGGRQFVLWTDDPAAAMSGEVGLIVSLADGTECHLALPAPKSRAVRVLPAQSSAAIVAIEAGVCFEADLGCLPIRLSVPAGR